MNLGTEDLAASTIATSMRGSISGMPSIMRIRTGQATAMLSDGNGTTFATTDLPVMEVCSLHICVSVKTCNRLA